MKDTDPANEVIQQLIQWAEKQAFVRVMLLTSSRANPRATVDVFSDYDVILVVPDIHPFFEARSWLQNFGEVLVSYWDPIHPEPDFGIETFSSVNQYANGLDIDFSIWPIELMCLIAKKSTLPEYLDIGYSVLVDKDHLTDGMPTPTYSAYIPKPPTEEIFHKVIADFFSDVPYVAKYLWREELMPVKWSLDYDMKHNFLRPMLEWRMELDQNWSASTGNLGRGLKKQLPSRIWAELERTYAAGGIEENWDALFRTIYLFREVGIEIAERLGYTYPLEMDQRITAYAQSVKNHNKASRP
ncbi:MAG TPA: aminoglycoside 6-adenylyltransferase [Anaerolineales bacterium]|jgi:aminoglycoside 6-adenylyltransferase